MNLILTAYQNEKWIVEGTTQWLLRPGLESTDIIIYLKYDNIFFQWFSIIKRHFTRGDETLLQTLHLLRHVFYKRYGLGYKRGKLKHAEVIAPYSDKVITLSSFKEINDFIDKIKLK